MDAIAVWVRQIGFLIVFASLIQLLLPGGSERKTVRFIVGLVVVLAMMEPLGRWFVDDGMGADTFSSVFQSGSFAIEQGEQLATEIEAQTYEAEMKRLENELGALLSLAAGVDHASVVIAGGSTPGTYHVRVILAHETSPTMQSPPEHVPFGQKDEGLAKKWDREQRRAVENRTRRFLRQVVPAWDSIHIEWR